MYAHEKLEPRPPAGAADRLPRTTSPLRQSQDLGRAPGRPICATAEPPAGLSHRAVRSIHVRPKPLASYCKQTPQPRSDRYTFASTPRSVFLCPDHNSAVTNHAFLPRTLYRVETHLSHRKQTSDHASTRNVPAHISTRFPRWRVGVIQQKSSCARKLPVCYSVDVPPRGTRATAPARPSQQWRPSPAHFLRSAGTSCQRPLPGRIARGHRDATGRHTCAL